MGKARELTLCTLEAYGPQTAQALAERLGWSRTRDLRARHLDPLVDELGLVERRGDGAYALVGDFRESQDRVRKAEYSTVQLRLSRRYVFEGGRRLLLTEVAETGSIASEQERAIKDKADHARQTEAYRRHLEERHKAEEREPEDEREVAEFLNRWDEERGTESVQIDPRYLEMRRRGSVVVEFSGAEVEDLERIDADSVPDREDTRIGADEVFEMAREMMAAC